MSRTLFAEITHQAYVENLRKELNACLENIIEATDKLEDDIWHVKADIMLRTNTQRFRELHRELGQVLEEDPVEWLQAMVDTKPPEEAEGSG